MMQSRNTNGTAKYYHNEGKKLIDQEQYSEAIEQFNKAIALDNNNANAYHSRGFARSQLKKYAEAINDHNNAIQLNPNNGVMYNCRAVALIGNKEFDQAIIDCNKAIKLNPAHINAHINRGIAYHWLEEYTKALADFSIAIGLDPNNSIAYRSRGFAYEHLGQYVEAIRDYKMALAINPDLTATKNHLKNAEKAQSEQKLALLSQRVKDTFASLSKHEIPPGAMPATLLNMMAQENELLDALLEHINKSDELDADDATNMTAAINQWRLYPFATYTQPLRNLPSLTPHITEYLRRKETIKRYITDIRLALLEIKNEANTSGWQIKHWLTGNLISGTPRHIQLIRQLLTPINEHSSVEAVMNAYKKMIDLFPTTIKKSRLPETVAFYGKAKVKLTSIMFNAPPPSYAEHMERENNQVKVLTQYFPDYTTSVYNPDFYILQNPNTSYCIMIDKIRFAESVAEKFKEESTFANICSFHLSTPSPAACAAITQAPAVTVPTVSSSSASLFAATPVATSAADAADEIKKKLPAVPTHLVSEPMRGQRVPA